MDQEYFTGKFFRRILSYVLVAAIASGVTWALAFFLPSSKLEQISKLIEDRYIGESDRSLLEDKAAAAMVRGLGDRWSAYIPAEQYQAHVENQNNEYVGIGVTIIKRTGAGFEIVEVAEGSPAEKAGVCPGDFITHVDGQDVTGDETNSLQDLIPGKVNTKVDLTLRRGQETVEVTVKRKMLHQIPDQPVCKRAYYPYHVQRRENPGAVRLGTDKQHDLHPHL